MNKDTQVELLDFAGEPESSRRYFGWRVVAVLFVVAVLSWGFGFYGHAVYLAELRKLHGWSTSLIATASTIYYLVSAVLMIFVNDAIGRLGARNCILSGAMCFAVAILGLSQAAQIWQLFAAYLVMALGWAFMTVGAITNILGQWFDRKRGLAISLALNGASFGGVLVVPAMIAAISAYGFSRAMLVSALVIIALAMPLAIFVLGKPAPKSPLFPLAQNGAASQAWTRASTLRSAAFWVISVSFSVGLLSQAGVLVHQVAFLETSIGREGAAIAVALTTATSICGRLAMGTWVDRINLRIFTTISFGSQALALLAMTQTTSFWPLLLLCAIYGLSVGNVITLPSLIVQREFPAAAFGMIVALSTAITQFVYAFGPGLVGIVRDASVNYAPALVLCALFNLAAAGLIFWRPKL
ncbi:MAG: MFS transporter [Xanthobacteraceae bacterium]